MAQRAFFLTSALYLLDYVYNFMHNYVVESLMIWQSSDHYIKLIILVIM